MTDRVDQDIARLQQLAREHPDWFKVEKVTGKGLQRIIHVQYRTPAYASRRGEPVPVLRPGPWTSAVALARGVAVQPLVRLLPDADGYIPSSGNISDWTLQDAGADHGHAPPGLVCFADSWDPTRVTLAWLATQVARIIVGEVLNLEAHPLSIVGRNAQAEALAEGRLPTAAITMPRPELLYLGDVSAERREAASHGIDFGD